MNLTPTGVLVVGDDEIVETSDTEEREALQLQRVADIFITHNPVPSSFSTRLFRSQAINDRPSPRKRRKVRLQASCITCLHSEPSQLSYDLPGFRAPHVLQASSSSSPGPNQSDGTRYSPFSPLVASAIPSSPSTSNPLTGHSQKSNSLAATPGLDLGDNENRSQSPLDMFSDFSQQIQVSPFSPIHLTPNPSSPSQGHQQPDRGDEEIPRELANNTRRYSMRERRPQQLNPYIYDKMLYKRQMKSNPDAIIKFASPRRRSHSRGAADNGEDRDVEQTETQDSIVGMDLDEDWDENWVDRRERRRSRSKNGDSDALADSASMYPELESSDDDQPDMKKLLKEAKKVKERTLRREREEAKEKARREKAESAEKEAGNGRRSKPFPVLKKQISARAKLVEETDEDISMYDRRSRSSVGECYSVALMVLIFSTRYP